MLQGRDVLVFVDGEPCDAGADVGRHVFVAFDDLSAVAILATSSSMAPMMAIAVIALSLSYPAFQIRVAFDFMLRQKVQRPGSLFQVVELCPLLVPCGLLGLDAILQINPQRNFAVFFGLPLHEPPDRKSVV